MRVITQSRRDAETGRTIIIDSFGQRAIVGGYWLDGWDYELSHRAAEPLRRGG